MNTKIFFTDLDGTLLTSEKKVSPCTFETLKNWTAKGHKLVLCSGRALDSITHVRETLGLHLPNMYLIGSNGGEIYDCSTNTLLLRTAMACELVKKAFDIAAKYNIHIQTYNDTHIITGKEGEELAYYRRSVHTPYIITDDFMPYMDKPPCKCLAIELHDLEKLEAFRQEVYNSLGGEIDLMYSHPTYIEIYPAKSGKGFGVKWLCEHLNIPVENALAAGDENNDLSMLQAAGTGIAMLNARDTVKEAADIITEKDNDHDGLVPILEQAMNKHK